MERSWAVRRIWNRPLVVVALPCSRSSDWEIGQIYIYIYAAFLFSERSRKRQAKRESEKEREREITLEEPSGRFCNRKGTVAQAEARACQDSFQVYYPPVTQDLSEVGSRHLKTQVGVVMAAADGSSSDDGSSSEWEMLSESTEKSEKRVTEVMAVKRAVKKEERSCKKLLPLKSMPSLTWRSTPRLKSQFVDELTAAHYRHLMYVERCQKTGIKPIPLRHFCFEILCQSGWIVQKGKFTLSTSMTSG